MFIRRPVRSRLEPIEVDATGQIAAVEADVVVATALLSLNET